MAVADALIWPAAWIVAVSQLTIDVGLIGRASVAVALLIAIRGTVLALSHNERYYFIGRRVWSVIWPLLAIGAALHVAIWWVRN